MSAAESTPEDGQPLTSFEVPMEAVPHMVVPRLELAVRVPPPPVSVPVPVEDETVELPMEPVPVLELEPEREPEAEPEPDPSRLGRAEAERGQVPTLEREEAGPSALRPEAPEPASSAVTRPAPAVEPVEPVRPARPVRPGELDRRHPVRGALGLVAIVVFGAIAVSLLVGAAIAAVVLAVRGGVGS